LLLSLGVVVVSAGLVSVEARPAFEAHLMTRLQGELQGRAQLVAALAEAQHPSPRDPAALTRLARDLATEGHTSVEILGADGVAVARSDGALTTLRRAREADVVAARAAPRGQGAVGFVVEGRKLFSAARFRFIDGSEANARVGTSLGGVDAALAQFRDVVVGGAVLLLALLLVVSSLMARFTARGLDALNDVARRMVEGDLEARSGLEGDDQLSELGRTLDKLARGLSTSLKDLRGERDRMAGILEGMQEGVILLDAKRRIVVLNPALREMLLLPADAIGKPLLEVVRNAELRDLFAAAAAEDEPTTQEVEIGNIKPRRLLARVARMPGEARQLVAVFVDVTEVRRLESMRRDFVANVSHELRTPVTAIRSAAETLQTVPRDEHAVQATFVGIVARNAERLHELVEDLLDLSRIESQKWKLLLEPLDTRAVFEQVASLFRERADRKRVELVPEAPAGLCVLADRRALEHVLTNLVDNAVKYCGERSRVVLRSREHDGKLELSVEDEGPGIEERHLPRLFERFYRVDAGRAREVGGTGLGLSIVKHLTEAMGGTVAVSSKPGAGTTLVLTLKKAEPGTARAVA
jgi:two-component system phosphate regulon sensor histidine kinase PhoR